MLVLAGLLILRRSRPDKCRWWYFLLPILTGAFAFGLDYIAESDGERIESLVFKAVEAVQSEDCSAIANTLADDYHDSSHRTKASILAYCRSVMAGPLVEKIYKRIIDCEISSATANVVLLTRILFDKRSDAYQLSGQMVIKSELVLRKQPGGNWLIQQVEIAEINGRAANWPDIR